ncbi:MAG: OapA family protein, partial [Rhodanobacteraceae bacterium]
HWSFHADAPATGFRWTREAWVLGGGALLLALLTLLGIPAWARVIRHASVKPATHETVALKLPTPPRDDSQPIAPMWNTVEVQPGDTLSGIFQARGFDPTALATVMADGKDTGALKTLHPGDEVAFQTNAKGRLVGFRYDPDAGTQVTLTLQPDGSMRSQMTTFPIERQIRFAHGVVHSSLLAAGTKAGLSRTMVLKLADVFKHDSSFPKNLKPGAHFTVIYDKIYRDGKSVGDGNVLAVQFVNAGHRYTAYRFMRSDDSVAYYSQNGRPLGHSLLRTPLRYTYISSVFGMRKDPITHRWQLHAGVDYAAPVGTPIHAAGSGVITTRGWVHGFGNFIAIRNTPKYTTEYGHMSRFANGLHVGSHVTQGEVIGYVGDTGFATGPHLHYEVVVNGRPENPLTVTMPKPQPLSGKLMAEFKAQTAPLVAHVQMIDNATQRLARVDHTHPETIRSD